MYCKKSLHNLTPICCVTAELGLLENPQQSLKYLEEVEMLGEEIVRDKQEVVALDRRRNQNREALRALRQNSGKTWLTLGSLLVKMSGDKAKELLEQGKSQLSLPSLRQTHTDR
jgi:chaperonin cofactor prefoldin